MPVQVLSIESVISDPAVRGGRPVVAGTTLRVSDLAAYHVLGGWSAEQLAVQFELNLARVHAALSYYYDHKPDIDAEIRANEQEAATLRERLAAQGLLLTL